MQKIAIREVAIGCRKPSAVSKKDRVAVKPVCNCRNDLLTTESFFSEEKKRPDCRRLFLVKMFTLKPLKEIDNAKGQDESDDKKHFGKTTQVSCLFDGIVATQAVHHDV